jgi:hypothetical protein
VSEIEVRQTRMLFLWVRYGLKRKIGSMSVSLSASCPFRGGGEGVVFVVPGATAGAGLARLQDGTVPWRLKGDASYGLRKCMKYV